VSLAFKGGGRGVQHIKEEHIDVATNTFRGTDGKIYYMKYGRQLSVGTYDDFYLEPETGILRESGNYRKWRWPAEPEQSPKPLTKIEISADKWVQGEFFWTRDVTYYGWFKGIWYYVEAIQFGRKQWHYCYSNVIPNIRPDTGHPDQIVRKRQLSKKELKKIGLR
jgi:hypothetical protein